MSLPDAVVTVYCDEPSHCDTPVGLLLKGTWLETGRLLADADEGVFIWATMERGRERAGAWTARPTVLTPHGLRQARRGGGFHWAPDNDASPERVAEFAIRNFQPVRGRFGARCAYCGLSFTRQWPAMVQTLDTLTAAGITAISLRGLIDTT
ncbi:hypothetical protein [Mycolicibacterium tusciae]|uniref:Uncharacterized protein n=1 Tax=Mycolicibacterium tusciae TaxID=75922 RepID=A0A1X0K2Z1_9MYCO|nr:hypothetical protein [Mycolicibacterium tusciae]ORB68807.1 hypothetical protein BST47_02675 [Mycolicibacterium tusciae]